MNISGAIFKGHIETRTLGQWPCKEESLFVVVNDPIRPHFPIALSDFLSYYGTVTKLS